MTEITRDKQGKFAKGVSANPSGRPVGAKNKMPVIADYFNDEKHEDIMAIFETLVKQGDRTMMKIYFDKFFPNADKEMLVEDQQPTNVEFTMYWTCDKCGAKERSVPLDEKY